MPLVSEVWPKAVKKMSSPRKGVQRRELGMGSGSRASKRPRGGGGDTEQVWTHKPGR